MSRLGVKWSGTRAIFSRSKTCFAPAWRKASMARGAVMSLARARSTSHTRNSPGRTSSRPAWRARIFPVMVMPMDVRRPRRMYLELLKLAESPPPVNGDGPSQHQDERRHADEEEAHQGLADDHVALTPVEEAVGLHPLEDEDEDGHDRHLEEDVVEDQEDVRAQVGHAALDQHDDGRHVD